MLRPMNRHLVVQPILEQKKESGVLVPDDFLTNESEHSLVELISASPDVSSLFIGQKLVVPTHMLQEIDIFGQKFHVVLINHVIGILDD
jgi:co-chaperonin GroES (HSP10)